MNTVNFYRDSIRGVIAALVLGLASFEAGAVIILNEANIDCEGPEINTPAVNAALQGPGCANTVMTELYKSNVPENEGDDPVDEGPFADSYDTTFDPPTDPEDALIAWINTEPFIDPAIYTTLWALAKDGAAGWYAWDLTALGWDGMEDLSFQDLWAAPGPAGAGAISHVSIFGAQEDGQVPEPGTLGLLGLAAAGFALVIGRRRPRR